jgi:hypothetical protein
LKLTRRIPIARIKQGVRLVLEMDTPAPGFLSRETIFQLDQVKALLIEGDIDMDGALLLLMAFRHRVETARRLALKGKLKSERRAVQILRQA